MTDLKLKTKNWYGPVYKTAFMVEISVQTISQYR